MHAFVSEITNIDCIVLGEHALNAKVPVDRVTQLLIFEMVRSCSPRALRSQRCGDCIRTDTAGRQIPWGIADTGLVDERRRLWRTCIDAYVVKDQVVRETEASTN